MKRFDSSYDVVVIGLGPVGAFAANQLGRMGLKTLAVDRSMTPFMQPRAIAIDDMSLRLLQPLGVPDMITSSTEAYRTSEYRTAAGEVIRRIRQPAAPFFHAWTPYNTFVQPELEKALRGVLASCDAIDVGLGIHASVTSSGEDGVGLVVEDVATGESRQITCKYLLACDGASSAVREMLGITLEDMSFDEPWLVVDIIVNETANLPEVNIQHCDPARPYTYVRGPGMLRRWEIMLLPGEEPEEVARHDNIWKLLASQLTPDQGRIWRSATYRFHALVANEWQRGNIFLLGDAAHQTPPFMGQGLNQGLRDVGNLCWKIGAVFYGRASNNLLDSYQPERRPMTKDVIETAKQLGLIICEIDEAAAARRNQRMIKEVQDGHGEFVRQDLIPSRFEEGFMMCAQGSVPSPGAGSIFPQPIILKDGSVVRLDDILKQDFVLVARPGWAPDEELRQKASALRIDIVTLGEAQSGVTAITEKDGVLARWMADLGVGAVLVRPDHFVFGTAGGDEPEVSVDCQPGTFVDSTFDRGVRCKSFSSRESYLPMTPSLIKTPGLAHFIGGEWLQTEPSYRSLNPSDITDVVANVPQGGSDILEQAISAASTSFAGWAAMTPEQRGDILDKAGALLISRADAIGHLLSREQGKTIAEGRAEVIRAGRIFRYFGGEAIRCHGQMLASVRPGIEVTTRREPLGVVGLITPWNFPIAIPAWKAAPALAFGNSVVLKSAAITPATAAALAEVLFEAGLPSGVFNLIFVPGAVASALARDPRVKGISFTGSTSVGRSLAADAGQQGTRLQLEMGGKNPLVILDDADLDKAVAIAWDGAYLSAGQRCTASSRLIVTEAIHDRFVAALSERLHSTTIGHALDPRTQIGPVSSEEQVETILGYIDVARAEGANVHTGGHRLGLEWPGYYLAPALITETRRDMRINREEIFGPVASVVRVRDYEEAIDVANDCEFGLSAGIVTTSLRHANNFRRDIQAGMAMVNVPTAGVDYHVPFGGTKNSSYGPSEQGYSAVEFYTKTKTRYLAW